MTNEEMLQRVEEITLYLSEEDNTFYRYCVADGQRDIQNFPGLLAALALDLRDDIADGEARKSGRSSAQAAAKRIIKNAFAVQKIRESLHGAWMENGKQCLCDGFHAVILDSAIPGLPQVEDDLKKVNLSPILAPARKNDGAKLPLPTAGELKAAIKIHDAEERARKKKAKDRKPLIWEFGEDLPWVNGNYLLDLLELLPGCTATASSYAPDYNAIYFQAEGIGEGILMPIRKQSGKTDS